MKTLKLICIAFICLGFFAGCLSQKQRARNLVRKGWQKVEKGLEIDPTLADSVYQKKIITIDVPNYVDSTVIETVYDSVSFKTSISKYDSLLMLSDSLATDIENNNLQGFELEAALSERLKVSRELLAQRDKFLVGFAVDSVYLVEDSIYTAEITIENGALTNLKIDIKPQSHETTVNTTTINLDGRRSSWRLTDYLKLAGVILGVLILIVLFLSIRKFLR